MKNLIMVLLVLTVFLGSKTYIDKTVEIVEPFPTTSVSTPEPLNEQKLFDLVNEYRVENNLGTLTKSDSLCSIASERVKEIEIDWSHDGFRKNANRYKGITGFTPVGENLAKGHLYEENILRSWVNSPLHKANLDEVAFTHMCIKIEKDRVVQIFGGY